MVPDERDRHDQRHEAVAVVLDERQQLRARVGVELVAEVAGDVLQHVRVTRRLWRPATSASMNARSYSPCSVRAGRLLRAARRAARARHTRVGCVRQQHQLVRRVEPDQLARRSTAPRTACAAGGRRTPARRSSRAAGDRRAGPPPRRAASACARAAPPRRARCRCAPASRPAHAPSPAPSRSSASPSSARTRRDPARASAATRARRRRSCGPSSRCRSSARPSAPAPAPRPRPSRQDRAPGARSRAACPCPTSTSGHTGTHSTYRPSVSVRKLSRLWPPSKRTFCPSRQDEMPMRMVREVRTRARSGSIVAGAPGALDGARRAQ